MSTGDQITRALTGLPSPRAPRATVRYVGSKPRGATAFPAVAAQLGAAFAELTRG
jgi:hypothetical protein